MQTVTQLIDEAISQLIENWHEGCHTSREAVEAYRPTLASVAQYVFDAWLDDEVPSPVGLGALAQLKGGMANRVTRALARAQYIRHVD